MEFRPSFSKKKLFKMVDSQKCVQIKIFTFKVLIGLVVFGVFFEEKQRRKTDKQYIKY